MISEPEELVKAAYNVVFGRDPEPAGLRHWASAVQHGLRREDLLRALLSSLEFRQHMGVVEGFSKYEDVDLIIPLQGHQFRVPAAELSLVPHLLDDRIWEPHLTRYLRLTLKTTDLFMDVGANLGYFTVICAPLVRRVVAFEPVSTTHKYCEANIVLNGLTNVDLYKYGLWSDDTETHIRADPSSLMSASISRDNSVPATESICCVSLDGMIQRGELHIPRIDVIKMDIEGAEAFALQGMKQAILRFRPMILMELNRPALGRFGKTLEDVWDFFRSISYMIEAFTHWQEIDPTPVRSVEQLQRLCPADGLIDILARP
jgi:FkbM family methyltransferase